VLDRLKSSFDMRGKHCLGGIPVHNFAMRGRGIEIQAVPPNQVTKNLLGGWVRSSLPADDQKIRIAGIALLMVGFSINGGEKRRNVLNLMINGFF
jgi:hypothetical protein